MIKLDKERVNIRRRIDHFPLRIDDRQRVRRRRRQTGSVVTPGSADDAAADAGIEARRFRWKRESGAHFVGRVEGIFECVARLQRCENWERTRC